MSQGTVRKAMSILEETGLVDRQQGRGTFVRKLSEERSYYHFFRLAQPNGERVTPEPDVELVNQRAATKEEQNIFNLAKDDSVVSITRLRCVNKVRATSEHIVVPASLFNGLVSSEQPLPLALYPFYHQRYGIFVLRAEEYIAAISVGDELADELHIKPGDPVLQVHRTAFDMKNRPVEKRTSHFRADLFQYQVDLS